MARKSFLFPCRNRLRRHGSDLPRQLEHGSDFQHQRFRNIVVVGDNAPIFRITVSLPGNGGKRIAASDNAGFRVVGRL